MVPSQRDAAEESGPGLGQVCSLLEPSRPSCLGCAAVCLTGIHNCELWQGVALLATGGSVGGPFPEAAVPRYRNKHLTMQHPPGVTSLPMVTVEITQW